jgi:hypothetical protein
VLDILRHHSRSLDVAFELVQYLIHDYQREIEGENEDTKHEVFCESEACRAVFIQATTECFELFLSRLSDVIPLDGILFFFSSLSLSFISLFMFLGVSASKYATRSSHCSRSGGHQAYLRSVPAAGEC